MSKKSNIFTIILILLVVILTAGLIVTVFTDADDKIKDKLTPVVDTYEPKALADVEYNATYGTTFKTDFPITTLTLVDNMSVAPYSYKDTTLFKNKRITKIDAPIATVTAVNENQYFTLWVIPTSVVKASGKLTDGTYKQYKVYLPQAELTGTTVNKWITIDLTDQNIYVGANETLAFMKSDDPVKCAYSNNGNEHFVYDLMNSGKEQNTQSIYYGIYTDDYVDLTGKNISILGDSISTFGGISNDSTNANSTISGNAVYFPKYDITSADMTWWKQTADRTGADILVNNSWSGSRVLNNNGAAYQTRCEQLHDDTGVNSGTQPDIIAVYIGINDFDANLTCGTFNQLSDVYDEETGYITPTTFAQAYAIVMHKLVSKYDNADVFVFTLPPNGTNRNTTLLGDYNEQIEKIAKYFKVQIVDIGNIEGYQYSAYTSDGLHPNEKGMDLITDMFARSLKAFYEPATEGGEVND